MGAFPMMRPTSVNVAAVLPRQNRFFPPTLPTTANAFRDANARKVRLRGFFRVKVAERMGFEGNFRVRMSLNFNNRTFLRTVCGQVIRQLC
jgi:hypothetical protein